jgi:hypothetical protein
MADIKQELDRIKGRISDPAFLANKGLSNEVGIHVFKYGAKDELTVRNYIERFINAPSDCYRVIERDMFKIFLDILTEEGFIDTLVDYEEENGRDELLEEAQTIASPKDYIVRMRYEPHEPGDVLFLTGAGKVFPFMRSHILLEMMQKEFHDIPIVLFYPGNYNGQNLILFDMFHDGNYYRAFNLL